MEQVKKYVLKNKEGKYLTESKYTTTTSLLSNAYQFNSYEKAENEVIFRRRHKFQDTSWVVKEVTITYEEST
jgi:hypothetical protein